MYKAGRNADCSLTSFYLQGKSIKFWSFCPASFRNIRRTFGISDVDYIQMFGATTKERFSEGRSGAFMFYTSDESLIVKTMSPEECTFLRKMAPNYEAYMTSNPDTLLTRFYGCHSVSLYGKMYCFVVMGNLFPDTDVVHRYDIKGLWVDRNAKVPSPVARPHAVIVMRRTPCQHQGPGMWRRYGPSRSGHCRRG